MRSGVGACMRMRSRLMSTRLISKSNQDKAVPALKIIFFSLVFSLVDSPPGVARCDRVGHADAPPSATTLRGVTEAESRRGDTPPRTPRL